MRHLVSTGFDGAAPDAVLTLGRVAAVARDDVADAAAAALLHPEAHGGALHTLTGPEPISFAEAATRMTAALGRPFSYLEQTVEEAYESRRPLTDQQLLLDASVSTSTAIGSNELAEVSDGVPRLTGHPARTLEQALAG